MIPRPFTRVVFCYGDPIRVPREATEAEMEACRRAVETGLNEATARAERALGEEALWRA